MREGRDHLTEGTVMVGEEAREAILASIEAAGGVDPVRLAELREEIKAIQDQADAEVGGPHIDAVAVRTCDYEVVGPDGVRRVLVFNPDTEVMVVCLGCGDHAAMPAAAVPPTHPRTADGEVESLCPRCMARSRGARRDD